MKKISKFAIIQIISVLLGISMTIFSCFFLNDINNLIKIITILLFMSFTIVIPSMQHKHKTIVKILFVSLIFCSVILLFYIILKTTGTLEKIQSFEHLKNLILKTKHWGIIVYLLLTIFQVVVLPIPSAIIILIGVAIYGAFWSFVLVTIGTYIGSIIAFWIGKTFGKKIVIWIVGEEATKKYSTLIYEKGKFMFALMMSFPMFSDDILCMVAGITNMTYKFFILTIVFARPVMIAATCFLGSGKIIPFSGWGIPVWIGMFLFCIALFLLFNGIKNNKKISSKQLCTQIEASKDNKI